MEHYKVGEIAEKIGVNIETLRYYEKIKIMPKPKRMESRYRIYDELDLKRLLFIKRAKELGFTLKEIKELLNIKIESTATCGDVKHLAENKLTDINCRFFLLLEINVSILPLNGRTTPQIKHVYFLLIKCLLNCFPRFE